MELKQLLRSKAYKPEDIFVLAPSIKNKSGNCTPVNKLENRLVADGIPCYVPTSDEGEINDDVILTSCESDATVNKQWKVYEHSWGVAMTDIDDVSLLINLFKKWSKIPL
jgi:hypothetical protein